MNKRNVVLLFSVFLVFVGQLLGLSGPIYVSTTRGQILRVDETSKGTTVAVVYTSTDNVLPLPEDLTVGPDNKLYVCDPTNGQIVRMDIVNIDDRWVGTNKEIVYQAKAPPTGPQGPRFNSAGTLFFNTKGSMPSGVWKIDGLAAIPFDSSDPLGLRFPAPSPVLSATQSGEGLAFTSSGDLLVVNQGGMGEVQCLPGPLKTCPQTITVTDPIGIAVNSVGDIFVARGGLANDIQRFTPKGVFSATYVTFGFSEQPFYLEFTPDDTLFVASSDATQQNGKFWKVDTKGSKTLLADLATLSIQPEIIQPAGAVGVGRATTVSIKKTFTGPQAYNFGANSFEVTAGACTATITARQRPPEEVDKMLQNSCKEPGCFAGTVPLTLSGGWATTWLVNPSVCSPPLGSDYYGIAISYFVDAPLSINPRIVRCEVSLTDGSWTGCEQLPDLGYYPQGPILGLPGDPISGTRSRSFSEYLLVNLPPPNGNFCGFIAPLNQQAFKIGATIPFKFQLTTPTTPPGCTGSFITNAKTVFTVARISPLPFVRMLVTPAGNANAPPGFRYDNLQNIYIFNLQTFKPTSKSPGWTAGTYAATVTSDSFFPQTILFKLQ